MSYLELHVYYLLFGRFWLMGNLLVLMFNEFSLNEMLSGAVCFAKLGVLMFIFASNGSTYWDIIAIL
jgi:hypothetical protein